MDLTLKVAGALLAVVIGILGAMLVFWVLNKLVELLPGKWEDRVKPYAFLFPAIAAIGVFLIYPAVTTVYASFFGPKDAFDDSLVFVGMKNYVKLFTTDSFVSAIINNVLWIVIVPAGEVAFGMLIAVLADRIGGAREKVAKSVIFLPMAISAVGASTIWRLVYAYGPDPTQQVGLINGMVAFFGGVPQAWLQITTLRLNTFMLMIAYFWTQVGYAMVLLSAAIKGVPEDSVEAGRIDDSGHRVHHRPDRRHEGVRHRVRDDEWPVRHRRHRQRLLQHVHPEPGTGVLDRGGADDRRCAGRGVPGPAVP